MAGLKSLFRNAYNLGKTCIWGKNWPFVHWRPCCYKSSWNERSICALADWHGSKPGWWLFPSSTKVCAASSNAKCQLMQVHVAIGCMTVLICSFPCWFCTGMPCVCTFLHWSVFACMHQLSCVISCFAVVHSELYTAFSSTSMVEKKWSELVWFYFEVLGIFSLLTSLQVRIFIVLVVRSILLMLLSFRCSVHFYLGIIWFSYISGY